MEKEAIDLIDKLLDYIPENRLGMKGIQELKNHPYFHDINFNAL